jgi:hypothetical protein
MITLKVAIPFFVFLSWGITLVSGEQAVTSGGALVG